MQNPRFEIFKGGDNRFYFRLKVGNGESILKSEGYTQKHNAVSGIESVKENAPHDKRYKRKVAENDQPYFNLTAANHETIGTSETYSFKAAMEDGIKAVKRDAPEARVDDLT